MLERALMSRPRQSSAPFRVIVAERCTRSQVHAALDVEHRGYVLKRKIALCAGVLAFSLAAPEGILAQPVPPAYPAPAHPAYAALPPHEIITIVRSTGLEPLSPAARRGSVYALRAVDPAGQEVRVIVDARLGRIVRVVPLAPRYAAPPMPPPYRRPPGRVAMVPDGYGPSSRMLPPAVDGPPENGAALLPMTPGHASPPRPAVQAGHPPLPRPRPKMAATAESPAAESTASATAPATPPQASPSSVEQAE